MDGRVINPREKRAAAQGLGGGLEGEKTEKEQSPPPRQPGEEHSRKDQLTWDQHVGCTGAVVLRLFFPMGPTWLEGCLAHSWASVSICGMNDGIEESTRFRNQRSLGTLLSKHWVERRKQKLVDMAEWRPRTGMPLWVAKFLRAWKVREKNGWV